MNKEAGKGHNKTLHINKKYKENLDKMMDNHTHRFNPSTGMCVHCFMHRDDLYLQASGEFPELQDPTQGEPNG